MEGRGDFYDRAGDPPRRVPEPPAAAAGARGHGAARALRRRRRARREGQAAALAGVPRPRARRVRPVRRRPGRPRLPRGARRRRGVADADLRGRRLRGPQLALGGRAVLRPRRQAARGQGLGDRAALQGCPPTSRSTCRCRRRPTGWSCASCPTRASACASTPSSPARASSSTASASTSPTAAATRRPNPDAYETLILDVIEGDATLFMRADEVEAQWRVVAPLLAAATRRPPVPYAPARWARRGGRAAGARRPPLAPARERRERRMWRPEPPRRADGPRRRAPRRRHGRRRRCDWPASATRCAALGHHVRDLGNVEVPSPRASRRRRRARATSVAIAGVCRRLADGRGRDLPPARCRSSWAATTPCRSAR
jgi:hypothetical protein